MVEQSIEFLTEKVETVVAAAIAKWETHWLSFFVPLARPDDRQLELFTVRPDARLILEDFSHATPQASAVYEGAFVDVGHTHASRFFVQGAAAVTNLMDNNESLRAGEMLRYQLTKMLEAKTPRLPSVSERFFKDYVDIMVTVLMGDEMTTWQSLLAYNAGVWWLMGLTGGTERVSRRLGLGVLRTHHEQVRHLLMEKARLGAVGI